jgi:hypothetical protein
MSEMNCSHALKSIYIQSAIDLIMRSSVAMPRVACVSDTSSQVFICVSYIYAFSDQFLASVRPYVDKMQGTCAQKSKDLLETGTVFNPGSFFK